MSIHRIWYVPALVGVATLLLFSALRTKEPQIVVQMPKDAAPLEQLVPAIPPISADAKVITQDRAVLWVTVFKLALDKGWSYSASAETADRAVKAAYGSRTP